MRIKILLKLFHTSKGGRNILKYETDKKKRAGAMGGLVAKAILYPCMMVFIAILSVMMGKAGMGAALPTLSTLIISVLAFVFSMLRVNGYMFGGKDYDLLMSLPFSVKDIVAARYIYMYLSELPFFLCMGVAFEIGYGIAVPTSPIVFIIWTLSIFFVPVLPMILATLLGTIIAGAGAKFKYKKAVTAILTFAVMIAAFFARYLFEGIFKNSQTDVLITSIGNVADKIKTFYPPAGAVSNAIFQNRILEFILFIVISVIAYYIVILIISKFYRRINSNITTSVQGKAYKISAMKVNSVVKTIAFKEFRHFMNSTTYLVNSGFGLILMIILTIAICAVGIEGVAGFIMNVDKMGVSVLIPLIPIVVYFCSGIMATTCVSPSLEGKNMWILDSLPVKRMDIYKGKALFNQLLFQPASVIVMIIIGIRIAAPPLTVILYVVCILALNSFSTYWGLRCGVKHIRLNWDNEVEVIKKGAALGIFMIVNMILTFAMFFLSAVFMGACIKGVIPVSPEMGMNIPLLIWTGLAIVLTAICAGSVRKMAEKKA